MNKRVLRIVLVLAGVAAAAIGACVGLESLDVHVSREAASSAWRAYGACLVGTPVEVGDHVGDRLRAIDLGLLTAPAAAASGAPPAGAPEGDWPGRCARHADELARLLSAVADHDARWSEASRLARVAANPADRSRVDPAQVDALSDALARLPLPAPDTTAVVDPSPPPGVTAALGAAQLAALGAPGRTELAADDPVHGAGLRLVWSADTVRVCRFDAGLARGRCFDGRATPPDAKLAPEPTADAAPSTWLRAVVTSDPAPVIVRADDGERLRAEPDAPVFVGDDGMPLTLANAQGGLELLRGTTDLGLAIPGSVPLSSTALARDAVLWSGADDRLHARVIDAAGTLGPIVDIGPLPPGEHAFALCRSSARPTGADEDDGAGEVLVARVTGGDRAATTFRQGKGAWSTPVASARAERPATLACHGPAATLTWMDHDAVRQIVCSPGACARVEARLGPDWDGGDLDRAAVDVGGRVLVVRHATHPSALGPGSVEGIVARFARVAELASAPDRVLLADAAHGGVDPSFVQPFGREDAAAVVVGARDGRAWAFRVGAAGDAAPIQLEP